MSLLQAFLKNQSTNTSGNFPFVTFLTPVRLLSGPGTTVPHTCASTGQIPLKQVHVLPFLTASRIGASNQTSATIPVFLDKGARHTDNSVPS